MPERSLLLKAIEEMDDETLKPEKVRLRPEKFEPQILEPVLFLFEVGFRIKKLPKIWVKFYSNILGEVLQQYFFGGTCFTPKNWGQ